MHINIERMIDEYLLLKQEERKEQRTDKTLRHYPTSASVIHEGKVLGSCLLKQYRALMQIPETNPYQPDLLLKFAWGDMVHDSITEMLKHFCLDGRIKSIKDEVPFRYEIPGLKFPISGRIDNIINENIGLEKKSSFGQFFFSKNGILKTGPKPEYIMQALLYLNSQPQLEFFILFYIARDTGFKKSYFIERVDNGNKAIAKHWEYGELKTIEYPYISIDAIKERWALLEQHIHSGVPPAPDFKFRSYYPCSGCLYYDMCYPEYPKKPAQSKYDYGQNE